jgi:hypothetical protein
MDHRAPGQTEPYCGQREALLRQIGRRVADPRDGTDPWADVDAQQSVDALLGYLLPLARPWRRRETERRPQWGRRFQRPSRIRRKHPEARDLFEKALRCLRDASGTHSLTTGELRTLYHLILPKEGTLPCVGTVEGRAGERISWFVPHPQCQSGTQVRWVSVGMLFPDALQLGGTSDDDLDADALQRELRTLREDLPDGPLRETMLQDVSQRWAKLLLEDARQRLSATEGRRKVLRNVDRVLGKRRRHGTSDDSSETDSDR